VLPFLSLELRFLVAPQIDTEVDQYQHGLTDAALLLKVIGSAQWMSEKPSSAVVRSVNTRPKQWMTKPSII
jgi:hypothetical protein